jgi:hypothetical protein
MVSVKKFILVFLIAAGQLFAALPASTVWEVRTGGSDTNGGGFVTGASGTDWSQQNGTQYSVTDGVTLGTTTITSATASFGTDVVGNIMYVQGGTGSITAGWYWITARASATSITVDRSAGLTTGTGVTLHIGGALLSPGIASSQMAVSGMIAYLLNTGSSVFSITSATSNIAGGTMSQNLSNIDNIFVGYATHRNIFNTDTPPTIQANVASAVLTKGARSTFFNLIFDGNSQASTILTSGAYFYRVTVQNFAAASTASTVNSFFIGCLATGNSATVFLGGLVAYSEAYGNTATPISAGTIIRTFSYLNTGAGTDGAANVASTVAFVDGLTSVANGRHGYNAAAGGMHLIENSTLQSNAGFGVVSGGTTLISNNNGFYNNASGPVSLTAPTGYSFNPITLTGTAFPGSTQTPATTTTGSTSGASTALTVGSSTGIAVGQLITGTNIAAETYVAAVSGTAVTLSIASTGTVSGNVNTYPAVLSLNALASQGAALRAAAIPALFPRGLTPDYADVGAVQSQATAGTTQYSYGYAQ